MSINTTDKNIREIAELILLQVNHNRECGKDDKFTIDEIVDIIKRRMNFNANIIDNDIRYF